MTVQNLNARPEETPCLRFGGGKMMESCPNPGTSRALTMGCISLKFPFRIRPHVSLGCVIVLLIASLSAFTSRNWWATHSWDYNLFQGIQYEMQPSRTVAMSPSPHDQRRNKQTENNQYSVVYCVAKLGYGKSSISNDSWILVSLIYNTLIIVYLHHKNI